MFKFERISLSHLIQTQLKKNLKLKTYTTIVQNWAVYSYTQNYTFVYNLQNLTVVYFLHTTQTDHTAKREQASMF